MAGLKIERLLYIYPVYSLYLASQTGHSRLYPFLYVVVVKICHFAFKRVAVHLHTGQDAVYFLQVGQGLKIQE